MESFKNNKNGWDWLYEQIDICPYCGKKPHLGNAPFSNNWIISCMNCNCENKIQFQDRFWGKAIVDWNNWARKQPKYTKKEYCAWEFMGVLECNKKGITTKWDIKTCKNNVIMTRSNIYGKLHKSSCQPDSETKCPFCGKEVVFCDEG